MSQVNRAYSRCFQRFFEELVLCALAAIEQEHRALLRLQSYGLDVSFQRRASSRRAQKYQFHSLFLTIYYLASNCISRFVRILYKILYPHRRHRTGSFGLIVFWCPQSPQTYITPRPTSSDTIGVGTVV